MSSEFKKRTASLTAQNTFTGKLSLRPGSGVEISVSGTFVATVTFQRSFDGGQTWLDVREYTAPSERSYKADGARCDVRIGIKTGDFTSGTAVVALYSESAFGESD